MAIKSTGVSGYVGKRNLYKHKSLPKRRKMRLRKRIRFIERIIDKKDIVKNSQMFLVSNRLAITASGSQAYGTILVQNSFGDLSQIGNNIVSSMVGGTFANKKIPHFNVNTFSASITMKNQVNANMIVDMYECSPRTNATQSIDNLLSTSLATAAGNNYLVTNTNNLDTSWGTTLYDCPMVTQNYRINRKVRYLLAPGACEIIELRDKRDYKIDMSQFYSIATAPSAGNYLRNKTKVYFFIVRGEPINDSTTKTNVGTTIGAVDFITHESYFYSYKVDDLAQSVNKQSTIGTITTGSSVLIDTGATVNPSSA